MSLASIILILQLALSVLSTPNLSGTQKDQALGFANQAILLATEALQQPKETTLGVASSSITLGGISTSTIQTTTSTSPIIMFDSTQNNDEQVEREKNTAIVNALNVGDYNPTNGMIMDQDTYDSLHPPTSTATSTP